MALMRNPSHLISSSVVGGAHDISHVSANVHVLKNHVLCLAGPSKSCVPNGVSKQTHEFGGEWMNIV